jgi:hypothetical protein
MNVLMIHEREDAMGYTSGYSSLNEIKESFLRNFRTPEGTAGHDWAVNNVLLKSMSTNYGRHMWFACHNKQTDQSYIIFYKCSKGKTSDGYSDWGYKDMDDSMGPCDADCPLELLDLTEAKSAKGSAAWRARVRAAYTRRQSNLKDLEVGMTVLVYGKKYELKEKVKRSWRARCVETGCTYKLRPSQIERFNSNAAEFIANVIGNDKEAA